MKVEWKPQPYAKELKAKASNERIKEALCLLLCLECSHLYYCFLVK